MRVLPIISAGIGEVNNQVEQLAHLMVLQSHAVAMSLGALTVEVSCFHQAKDCKLSCFL